jgi:hypothetical protein
MDYLIGFDLKQGLSLGDGIAFLDEPPPDFSLRHCLIHLKHS